MPGDSSIYLSIVIPAYNKESVIEKTLSKVTEFLRAQDYEWEVVVVDDASADATVALIKQFMAEHPDMKVMLLVNEQNRQKGATIRRGILEAKGKYALFLDADYAYPIEQVDNFFPTWETARVKKYHLLNLTALLDYLANREAGAVVLTEERFYGGRFMGKVLDRYRPQILEVLEENYYLAEELSYPSEIGRGNVYIYLPRQQ